MDQRIDREIAKYEAVWSLPDYAKWSPGETYAHLLPEFVPPPADVIDIGCGNGAGGRALKALGYNVRFLDIVCVTDERPFIQSAIWEWKPRKKYGVGFCCDVMEHLPTEYVGLSLDRIKHGCTACLLSIGLTPDHFGARIGETLHLTVKPFYWWRDFLDEFGDVEDARDLLHTGLYFVRF